MNNDREYRNRTYKDSGVGHSITSKARTAVLALLMALILTVSLALTGCGSSAEASSSGITAASTQAEESADNAASKSEMFTDRDLSGDYDESEAVAITLSGTSATSASTDGVSISGSTVTISREGVYIVSGTLSDGQIVVDADDSDKVQVVLKNASVTSSDSAAIYVKSADKVFVTLAAGTSNSLANGGSFTADGDTNVDGAVFAKDDITFNGSGSLTINSPAGHGVVGKDEVKFAGGTYTITAAKHGVQANDSVRMAESDVTVTSGAGKDGIHVSDNADEEEGTESDSYFYMADGSLTITSEDDGIHADAAVIIEGGTITVNKSYEGIEGLSISISGGSITVTATDDGLNAAGGNASSGSKTFGSDDWGGGFPGGGMSDGGANGSIVISGGSIHVTAGGDGIDSNGSLEITGGYTVIEGPTQGDTSVVDFNSNGTITGGSFIGTGGAGMAQSFTSAEQGLIAVSVGNQSAGSAVKLTGSNGDVIAEVTPNLDYAVVYISTEDMAKGETYTLTVGSYSESITLSDYLYSTLSGGRGGSFGGGGPRGEMNNGNGNNMDGNVNGGGQAPDGSGQGRMHGGGRHQGGPGSGERPDAVTGATERTDRTDGTDRTENTDNTGLSGGVAA